jgi:hypothetical protein
LVLILLVVWAEMWDLLDPQMWHTWATVVLAATMIAVTAVRRFRGTSRYELLHPGHVREVAGALGFFTVARENAAPDGGISSPHVRIRSTSLGVQISAGRINAATGSLYHYALSRRNGPLLEQDARRLASLVLQLRHPSGSERLIEGEHGVFHLLVDGRGR